MKNTLRAAFFGAAATVALIACGGDDTESAGGQSAGASNPTADNSNSAAANVTAEYLEGAWCYAFWESMGESEEPGYTYIFNSDGSLLYQHTPTSSVDRPGSWEVDGNRLKINPKFTYFNLVIKSVEPDLMILDNIGDHHFKRGACE